HTFTRRQIIRQFLLLCSTVAVFTLPWQIYIHTYFPAESAWEAHYNFRHFTEVLEGHGGPWYFHFEKMSIAFGDLFLIVLAWFTWRTLKQRSLSNLLLLGWLWIPLLFFTLAATKMTGYTLFTAPAAFIMTGAFCSMLFRLQPTKYWKIASPVLLTAVLFFTLRYSNERIKFFDGNTRNPRWVQQLRELKSANHHSKTVYFNMNRPVETMFYTGCLAYQGIPDATMVERLEKSGYVIVINADEHLMKDVSYINADALRGAVQED
ncbi:MAG: hypothetical protein ACRC3B_14635, partial [Bacteroidia bacterium]